MTGLGGGWPPGLCPAFTWGPAAFGFSLSQAQGSGRCLRSRPVVPGWPPTSPPASWASTSRRSCPAPWGGWQTPVLGCWEKVCPAGDWPDGPLEAGGFGSPQKVWPLLLGRHFSCPRQRGCGVCSLALWALSEFLSPIWALDDREPLRPLQAS